MIDYRTYLIYHGKKLGHLEHNSTFMFDEAIICGILHSSQLGFTFRPREMTLENRQIIAKRVPPLFLMH